MSFTPAHVVTRQPEAEGLIQLSLRPSDAATLAGYTRPGQFVQVKVGEGRQSYFAIANSPAQAQDAGAIELLVQDQSGVGATLAALHPGDEVEVSSVIGGGFALERAEGRPLLLFATGSGISPVRAVIEHLPPNAGPVALYFGARSEARLPWRATLAAWAARGVQVHLSLSQPEPGWSGHVGYVQTLWAEQGHPFAPDAAAVLCGVKGMVTDMSAALLAQGVPQERLLLNF
ncbi:MAG: NAD-binding oxidoreductase [Deltaproteobacteria bacterium]|nr:NAD-binding oxidoreductase [Deltaproteobacteria bacterium]